MSGSPTSHYSNKVDCQVYIFAVDCQVYIFAVAGAAKLLFTRWARLYFYALVASYYFDTWWRTF